MKRILKGPSRQKYTPSLRSFALTLNFYSPKAYNYVRETFNKSLPHPRTISQWYKSIDGSPGFTQEALVALKLKVTEAKQLGKEILCNLVIDEMAIRKLIEWTGKKFTGYVDVGTNLDGDCLPEAREALVFLLVALNDNWKIPVAYFLLNGLCGSEKANLVNKCLEFVHETGIIVTSLTFDGAAANINMASSLGANFENSRFLMPYFKHPVTQENVFIFFDPCHMIKLIRNCFGSHKVFKTLEGKIISWQYLEALVNMQTTEGLHAATKLKRRHLQWVREKMKVRIAAQTFSRSVADAILYLCEDLQLDNFKGAEETANFIKNFNDLFDILNSRNRLAKYQFKRPLSPATADIIFNRLESVKNYIFSLTLNGIPVLNSARKTGFLGFLICIESLKGFYATYIAVEKPLLKYVLTYKFSQDHLEILFSVIRSRGGYNNNPTARQFEATYKRLLVHSEIKGADTANAIALDATTILQCSSSNTLTETDEGEELLNSTEYLNICREIENHDYIFSSAWHLTDYIKDVVTYIAGFVIKCIKKCVTCVKCLGMLETGEPLSLLQKRKQFGKLINASEFVQMICTVGEKSFRILHATSNIFNKKFDNVNNVLVYNAVRNLPPAVYNCFGDHIYDEGPLNDHSLKLIKLILSRYFNIRIHHETMKKQDSVDRVRSLMTKSVLFKSQ